MASYNQVYVRCPFFVNDNGKTMIECEGIVDSSTVFQKYRSKGDYKIQMKTFCCDRYTNCEIYRVLIEKEEYAEDE